MKDYFNVDNMSAYEPERLLLGHYDYGDDGLYLTYQQMYFHDYNYRKHLDAYVNEVDFIIWKMFKYATPMGESK